MSRQPLLAGSLGAFVLLSCGATVTWAQQIPIIALRDWQWYNDAGWRYLSRGDYANAEKRFTMAIQEIKPYQTHDQRLLARSYCDLARVLYHEGRFADAEPLAKWVLTVREADSKTSSEVLFQSVYTLALIHAALHEDTKALPLLKRAVALQEDNLGPVHVNLALTLEQLAEVYSRLGRYPEAHLQYRRVLAIYERKDPGLNLDLAAAAERFAVVLRRMDRTADAEKWEAKARAIRDAIAAKAETDQADTPVAGFRGFK
jgi:tetratricopeptide (TPR) repeat protein